MDAAQTIREAVARVERIRVDANSNPNLQVATSSIKSFQARRFAGTYSDLLASQEYGPATGFFLEDLYSDKDYSLRDAQFARIAGGLQKLFPQQVIATAVSLAKLHVLTEELDRQMAEAWIDTGSTSPPLEDTARYVECWKSVDKEIERNEQLQMVLHIGFELDRLTRVPGLRMMLRMMRRPATAMGMGSLQGFLESGFDIFAHMSGKGIGARTFLSSIQEREANWIRQLSNDSKTVSIVKLQECLTSAR